MKKILWIGDAIIQSGFSNVTHNICNILNDKEDIDLTLFGICYSGFVRNPYPYYIYPAVDGGDIYSFKQSKKVLKREDSDVVVLFNDPRIIAEYMRRMDKYVRVAVPIFPVNYLPIQEDISLLLEYRMKIRDIIVYTEFAKQEVLKVTDKFNVHVMYHGANHATFYPIEEAKKEALLGSYFVVGNISSNTYRKRLDLFLKAFSEFSKGKEDVKALIHATNRDQCYNLKIIAEELRITKKVMIVEENLDLVLLNTMYNLMDVNVNTSMGEGFGLPILESAFCGVPNIVPDIGNLKDIWGDKVLYIDIEYNEHLQNSSYVGEVISTSHLTKILDDLYNDREKLKEYKDKAVSSRDDERFNWVNVAEKVYEVVKK